MTAFAANSILCRLALGHEHIDPGSFTAIRLLSGAVALCLLVLVGRRTYIGDGNWVSALALVVYAAGFSFAYVSLSAATGALLLFSSVQATMLITAAFRGDRLKPVQMGGLALAVVGLAGLLMPGVTAPSPLGAICMAAAGIAWGIYSLRGGRGGDPIRVTAGNFVRATAIVLAVAGIGRDHARFDSAGLEYAIASGALASGVGYAIWYSALPALRTTTASVAQLGVPVIAALGGAMVLGETIATRWVVSAAAILLGIGVVVLSKSPTRD